MAKLSSSFRRTAGAIASCIAGLLLLQTLIFALTQSVPAGSAGVTASAPVCAAASADAHPAPADGRGACASSLACCVAARPIALSAPLLAVLAPRSRIEPAPLRVGALIPSASSRRGWSSRAPPLG